MKTIQDVLKKYKVKTYKQIDEEMIAIRKGGLWLYFRFFGIGYRQTGSTQKLSKAKVCRLYN